MSNGSTVPYAQLSSINYTPATDNATDISWVWEADDGPANSTTQETISQVINPINDAPVAKSFSLSAIDEDTVYSFALSNFTTNDNWSDVDDTTFTWQISTLPAH